MKNINTFKQFVNEEWSIMDPFGRKKRERINREKEGKYHDIIKNLEDAEKIAAPKQEKKESFEKYIRDKFIEKVKKCGYEDVFPVASDYYGTYEMFDKELLNIQIYGDAYFLHIYETKEHEYYLRVFEANGRKIIKEVKSKYLDKLFDYLCKNYPGNIDQSVQNEIEEI